MSDLVTSLKALGAKMTGQDIAGKDLVHVVDNITENYEGGSGGGGGMIINTTGQFSSTEKHTDKSYEEVRKYIDDNNSYDVVLNDSIYGVAQLVAVWGTITSGQLRFARVAFNNGDLEITMYYLMSGSSEPTVNFETKLFSPKSA